MAHHNPIEVILRSRLDSKHPIAIVFDSGSEVIDITRSDYSDPSKLINPKTITLTPADLWDAVKAWRDKQVEEGKI